MLRSRPATPSLLCAVLLVSLAALLAWPVPACAATRTPGTTKSIRVKQKVGRSARATRTRARARVRIRDAALGAALARTQAVLLPTRVPGSLLPSYRLTAAERQQLEDSLQEEIAPPEAPAVSSPPSEPLLVWPVAGRLNSPFGPRRSRFHTGIDLGASQGAPVVAAADGRVLYARASRGPLGKTVVLEHADGLRTVYAHLSRLGIREGEAVRQGEPIGAVGRTGRATGPHLHFEVRHQGVPVPPQTFLPRPPGEAVPQLAASLPRPSSVPPAAAAAPPAGEPSDLPPPAIDPAS